MSEENTPPHIHCVSAELRIKQIDVNHCTGRHQAIVLQFFGQLIIPRNRIGYI